MRLSLAAVFVALTLVTSPSHAQKSGADYVIHILTFGPGDHPFFKFGHNAIWVHDKVAKTDKVYNWGTFYFDSPLLIPQFMKGLLRYWLSVDPLGVTLSIYKYENRTVDAQELALTDAETLELVAMVEDNAKPENAYYRYDYYMDNCSTRVRDVVDHVTRGALHATVMGEPNRYTFREHTRRLTQDDLPEYLALDIVMADFIDQPFGVWEEMFLPIKVYEALARTKIQRDEGMVPLVRSTKHIIQAPKRPPPPDAPPRWHLWFFLWGAFFGALAIAAGRYHAKTKWARFSLSLSVISGGLFGLLGCIFLVFWMFTNHRVAAANENILQCAPFAVIAFGLVRGVRKRRVATLDLAMKIAAGAVVLSVLGLAAKVLPLADQTNGEWICFFLPFWLGLTAALHSAKRTAA